MHGDADAETRVRQVESSIVALPASYWAPRQLVRRREGLAADHDIEHAALIEPWLASDPFDEGAPDIKVAAVIVAQVYDEPSGFR